MTLNSGQTLQAVSLSVPIDNPPGRMIAYASRTADSASVTAGEVGVLRVDGVKVIPGRRIYVSTSFNFYCANTGEWTAGRLRYATGGTQATVSSASFGSTPAVSSNSFTGNGCSIFGSFVVPANVTVVSILLSIAKISGTSATKSSGLVELPVIDGGADPTGFTAVIL